MCAFHRQRFTMFDFIFLLVQRHQPWETGGHASDNGAAFHSGFSNQYCCRALPWFALFHVEWLGLTEVERL